MGNPYCVKTPALEYTYYLTVIGFISILVVALKRDNYGVIFSGAKFRGGPLNERNRDSGFVLRNHCLARNQVYTNFKLNSVLTLKSLSQHINYYYSGTLVLSNWTLVFLKKYET